MQAKVVGKKKKKKSISFIPFLCVLFNAMARFGTDSKKLTNRGWPSLEKMLLLGFIRIMGIYYISIIRQFKISEEMSSAKARPFKIQRG